MSIAVSQAQTASGATNRLFTIDCGVRGAHPQTVRSPRFLSPDSRLSARIEVRSDRVPQEEERLYPCGNVSTLFVQTAGAAPRRVFQIRFSSEWPGNGMAFFDWSPDGKQLLVKSQYFAFGSDVIEDGFVLYRTGRPGIVVLSLRDLLSRHLGKECDAIFDRAGFSSTGDILVEATPIDVGSLPSCVDVDTWWQVNGDNPSISIVDGLVALKTHGQFEGAGRPARTR
jgi:hypothetical protein